MWKIEYKQQNDEECERMFFFIVYRFYLKSLRYVVCMVGMVMVKLMLLSVRQPVLNDLDAGNYLIANDYDHCNGIQCPGVRMLNPLEHFDFEMDAVVIHLQQLDYDVVVNRI